ncbi:uncharacterized protein LOC131597342 [Vicia villosa]|uniref:uncharacterized protein LOC131597342 n=1 Tax=Vicia villosa TaxID=3911 RepID=UPI00273BD85F|nr:uncharacterized protein LOC131597342 [Vicia villosa]
MKYGDLVYVKLPFMSMAGRNDVAISAALEVVAQAMQNQHNARGNDESHSLSTFPRENPPTFKGNYDPDGAHEWLKEIERIFRAMDCSAVQKRLKTIGDVITWAVSTRKFLRKYFPEDVRGKKEMEFLALKQGNLTVTEYAAKFVELVKFYPDYSEETAEYSKCIKFDNGLCPEIKRAIR